MTAWRRLIGDTSATAAAEMALVLPGIAFIILNVADMSIYIYTKMQVDLAAHEAVGYVRNVCSTSSKLPATYPMGHCSATLSTGMTTAAQSTSLGTNVTLGTPAEAYYCADPTYAQGLRQVKTIDQATTASPTSCSAYGTATTTAPGDYISVTASYTFSPLFPGASIAAMMPPTITRTAWMRLQ